MAEAAVLELSGVDASYGGRSILSDISVSFGERERVAILGHNGSGKSTLMKCFVGAVESCTGSIVYRGHTVRPGAVADNVRLGIGFARQGKNVFPSLSVEHNLRIAGMENREADCEEIFAVFPILKERCRQIAGSMSGGQQQMLAIGMALMTKPGILLLDEPTVGLAPAIAADVFSALDRVSEETGLTTLVVEQNVVPALRFAKRALVLKEGRIIYDGPKEPLLDQEKLISFY
jgi:branched-chain amino acid transport system ATP-binding protein